ncbi:HI0074 family nucleotidyltransferase substrate-binding subunit [Cyanobium sp. ATX-6F1]|uniref:HI0074 family nucleotidyltransferase substrate-binding subunit n=1 Tax=Cyanobium sp. ATX-6F1 TaxID=3137388 RepID=UPI0039BE837D
MRSEGNADLLGSRDTLREAFRLGLIGDGEAWMLMIQDRNITRHTYNSSTALEIIGHIQGSYLLSYQQLRERLKLRLKEAPHDPDSWLARSGGREAAGCAPQPAKRGSGVAVWLKSDGTAPTWIGCGSLPGR